MVSKGGSGLMLPPQRGVSRKLPGRCQSGHGGKEAIGEKKTNPSPRLVQGLYGIDPPQELELTERRQAPRALTPAGLLLLLRKRGKSGFKVKSSELCR